MGNSELREELNMAKSFLSYKRGVVISEQTNIQQMDNDEKSKLLANRINKEIVKIDDSMSYEVFASSVGQILRNEYGSHLFEKFIKVLSDDIGLIEK